MTRQWADEVTAFTRAFAGAAIFGIPLVFTVEMWWIGKTLQLTHLLLAMVVGLLANLALAHVAGFRKDHSFIMTLDQAIDAMAVGILSALALLVAINQVRFTDGLQHGLGIVLLVSLPLGLGASVARYVFSGRQGDDDQLEGDLSTWQGVWADAVGAAIGGVFIAISIAPTDEVKMISAGLQWWHLFMIVALSLFLSYLIVFASGFDEAAPTGPLQHPLTETLLAYMISLAVSLMLLLLFNRVATDDPVQEILRQSIVLALPATIGGAAGRLVI